MRDQHPGWGPITLLAELKLRPDYEGKVLPSRARVAAFLKAQGQVRRFQRRGGVPNPKPIPAIQPHDQWEMDAQGRQKVDGLGKGVVVEYYGCHQPLESVQLSGLMEVRIALAGLPVGAALRLFPIWLTNPNLPRS
jgi:hypothetical protein